ncbi:hypothetical protein B5S31_g4068 [[Candida] boidinii]|nr:hypothetical protein B5S31_g4068 [[Candida] boidinii]
MASRISDHGLERPTAKRSPSILVTDVRKGHTKAPFAGQSYNLQKKSSTQGTQQQPTQGSSANHHISSSSTSGKSTGSSSSSSASPRSSSNNNNANTAIQKLIKARKKVSNKYSNISVENIISGISDIPSSRERLPSLLSYQSPNAHFRANSPRSALPPANTLAQRNIPQMIKQLPSRTSKTMQKLVLIPDETEKYEYSDSTTDNIFQGAYVRTRAENLPKEKRANEYARVTAYLISEGFNLKLASKFLAKHHMVSPRLYDEVLYVPYTLPLLPGENGYRVQSNNSAKMQHGNELMENFLDKSEQKDHNYEFYSGEGGNNSEEFKIDQSGENIPSRRESGTSGDFDPSEPQFFVSSSPTESIIGESLARESPNSAEEEIRVRQEVQEQHEREKEQQQQQQQQEKQQQQQPQQQQQEDAARETERQANDHGRKDSFDHPQQQSKSNDEQGRLNDKIRKALRAEAKRRKSMEAASKLPNLSKHAEMFILDYGVVVFWNFTELHEKNILADLVFAKIQPFEFDLDDDDDDDDEDDEDEEEDEEEDEDEDEDDEEDEEGDDINRKLALSQSISLIVRPVPEHDIETEEFHFEYDKDISTPRIYNDMITLKSGDHLIKLTISHAIAQSTKLSLFESKMSTILNSISRLPKTLAITGKLQNFTRQKLFIKTGKLFQIRNEVNLSSNVLDTPEYFWSIEPGLHPLYGAIREYLEIDQRVEVINDRCKLFLDFFDIVVDSLAEKTMNRITWVLIIAIALSLLVSGLEIVVRHMLISRQNQDFV